MIKIGLDLGTKTIVSAKRGEENKPIFKHEINGFYEFPTPDSFTKKLLVGQKIPFVEKDGKIYALGRKAEQFAYAVNSTLRRPMADGTVSKEEEAINIMASIVHAIIGKLDDDAILYYCIPADAINKSTNVQFHQKIAQMIIDRYQRSKVTVKGYPINEARALAIGSGEPVCIAVSFGAGMVNVCYCMYGMSVFEFSLVGSGDRVDAEAARQFGYDPENPNKSSRETPTTMCKRKHQIDLTKSKDEVDRKDQAIMISYQILIENVVDGIIKGFNENEEKAKIDQAIPVVIAGGTSSPPGFGEYFEEIMKSKEPPFEISTITVHPRPLYAVAEGCLIASESHEE